MGLTDIPALKDLPEELRKTLQFFIENRKYGQITLHFKDGKMLALDYKLQAQINGGWPTNGKP